VFIQAKTQRCRCNAPYGAYADLDVETPFLLVLVDGAEGPVDCKVRRKEGFPWARRGRRIETDR